MELCMYSIYVRLSCACRKWNDGKDRNIINLFTFGS